MNTLKCIFDISRFCKLRRIRRLRASRSFYDRVDSYSYAADWVKSLKEKGYRVYILSNFGEKPFASCKSRMPFLAYVDGQLISYEVRQVKPDAAIYQALCDKFSIDPQNSVFIDDSAINIAGAKDFGLNTILFTTYSDAVTQLKALPLAYGL